MIAETTTQAAGSHGCAVHGMGGWQGVARSGFVRSARARHGAAGKTWPGLAPRDADGWPGLAMPAVVWLLADWSAGMERRGLPARDVDLQARSGVDSHREARIRRHGDARTGIACSGSAGRARIGRSTQGPAKRGRHGTAAPGFAWLGQSWLCRHGMASLREEGCGWRGSALLRSDGTVLELLAWLGGRATLRQVWIVMTRWACNLAAGMALPGLDALRRHRRHGTDWLCRASLCVAGLARHGCASLGLRWQAWQRTLGWASHGSAGMAWHRSERRGAAGVDLHCCDRMGLSWSCWHG
jgi:hypothetical protein